MEKQRSKLLTGLFMIILLLEAVACTDGDAEQISVRKTPVPPQVSINNDEAIPAEAFQEAAALSDIEIEPLPASPTLVAVPQIIPTAVPTPIPEPTNQPTDVPEPVPTDTTTTSCANVTEIPQSECEALSVLVPDYLQQPVNSPCSWSGVICTNQQVTDFQWIILDGNASPEISSLINLTSLYIIGNYDLYSLPPEIGELISLTTLGIGHFTNLSSLPPEIGNLTNLSRLTIQEGQINLSSLLPEIGNLTNLTELDLLGSSLNSLPPEIGNLTNLEILVINASNINNLPSEIGRLTNLAILGLSYNYNLSSLPPEVGNLTNLTSLNLNDNGLSSLPLEIGNLTNLTSFILYDDNLSSLPPEICAALPTDITLALASLCTP